MSVNIGRYLNAVKNADGTVTLEFAFGNFPMSTNRSVMTLSSAEVTALQAVCSGGTGTKSSAVHAKETVAIGEHDH